MHERKLMTVLDASDYLNVPTATLYTWVHQKKIAHLKFGRSLRFDIADLNAWVESRRVAAQLAQSNEQSAQLESDALSLQAS